MDPIRIHRKEAVSMDELVKQYIRSMKLAAGLNTQRIFSFQMTPFSLRTTVRSVIFRNSF